ncbi:hypothetical protein [Kitasatospora paranensis]|uniref:Gram-positive cocci surface proteins LPxTG domain-containing protein n=1 Tax=Kitasatospora paranensis TaxID=258053 RepID=A0ABW2FQK5_9ACTN
MPARRLPRLALLAVLVAVLSGWGAATALDWNGPCQPRFPGVDRLVSALPTFACFSVGGAADGYVVDVSYSGMEHDPQEALALAYAEAGVFWRQFPYRLDSVNIDTTAAFGESAIKNVTLTGDQLATKFGNRPDTVAPSGPFPEQPVQRTQIALWAVSVLALVGAVLLTRRHRAAGRRPAQ